jgi:hypothetical protein
MFLRHDKNTVRYLQFSVFHPWQGTKQEYRKDLRFSRQWL